VRPSDHIRLTTPQGTFRYAVQASAVVDPHDTWVLDGRSEPSLTLVTCYPFDYVGSAPRRFIVWAVRERPQPSPAATGEGPQTTGRLPRRAARRG
jgi:sortase A